MIFADRNKEYGTYLITKSSARRVKISFLSASGIFILLVLILGGGIWLPWYSYSDEYQNYNTVSVKYDPNLITALSKPSEVIPKKDKQQLFTEPRILEDLMEIAPVEDSTAKTEKEESTALNEESKKDSLDKPERIADEQTEHSSKSNSDTVLFVEKAPQFPGGPGAMQLFISNNLKYPIDALSRKVQGTVMMSFVVERDGSIRRIIITKAVDPVIDFEAVRLIASMPHWQPASNQGKPIASMVAVPINFSLQP